MERGIKERRERKEAMKRGSKGRWGVIRGRERDRKIGRGKDKEKEGEERENIYKKLLEDGRSLYNRTEGKEINGGRRKGSVEGKTDERT